MSKAGGGKARDMSEFVLRASVPLVLVTLNDQPMSLYARYREQEMRRTVIPTAVAHRETGLEPIHTREPFSSSPQAARRVHQVGQEVT